MIGRLFARKPDAYAEMFAEAQALLDDGLDLDFVLGLFPDDAERLKGDLDFAADLSAAFESEAPSFYFEASLKSKFVAAGRSVAQPIAPSAFSPFRTAVASMGVLAGAGIIGVLSLGFITAGNSVPGDWNYSFKLANERLQYALSSGDERVDIQLKQAEARVYEIRTLTERGDVSPNDIQRFRTEAQGLADLARNQNLDDVQRARLVGIAGTSQVVLKDARTTKPALEPSVNAAAAAVNAAVSALSPTPAATATATATATTTSTATAEPTASTTPTPPTATATATSEPSPTATHTPPPTATGTAEPSATSSVPPTEPASPTAPATSTAKPANP